LTVGRHADIRGARQGGQRVLRTGFQWLVGSVFPVAALIGYANDVWGGELLGPAVAASGLLTTFLSKVMADPVIDAWLCSHTFLGSLPRADGTLPGGERERMTPTDL
jgi:hypothetical protein